MSNQPTNKLAKNVPVVMQMEATECGAACLTMILAYFGRWVPLEQVRSDCGVSRDGSKASNILKAARSYGLKSRGFSFGTDALKEKGVFPCILFWNFNHFVVLNGFKGGYAILNDPARGNIKVTMDEFDTSFTGVVLTFIPTEEFEPGGAPTSTLAFARERLRGMGLPLLFVAISTAVVSITTILNTTLSRVFLDQILSGDSPDWLVPVLALMSGMAVIQLVVGLINALYLNRIRGKFSVVSSSRFMWHLLRLPVSFYSQRSVGDLQQRQDSNESIAITLVQQLAPTLLNAVLLVLYLVVMVRYSWPLTIVGLLTVLINVFVANAISRQRINITRQQMRDNGMFYAYTIGGISMIETIKASGAEEGFFEHWAGLQANVNDASVRFSKVSNYLGSVPGLVTSLANISVLMLGTYLIMVGEFTVGSLLSFQGLLSNFMGPVNEFVTLGQSLQEMRTSMERVQDVLDYETDVSDDQLSGTDGDEELSKLSGALELSHISFGYSKLEPPLIQDFSLSLKPGSWVALVGASGSGKSTIAKLLSGLYKPWEGEVKFDGTPIDELSRARLRGSLAVVDQDIVTFEDSVATNIRLWDESIEDFEVILAARDADVHDEIMARDMGYRETVIAGGRNFSGGQLQRLEIARALAQDPTIVVLDEATSALDAQTEAHVIEAIRAREITCVVVAHRLSTIRDCDEIIVLDQGSVVERGTHDELLAANGEYARLVRSE